MSPQGQMSKNAGQQFEGYLLLDGPELASRISQAVGDTLWLGADRHAGFGKCSVSLELVKRPAWMDAYGFKNQEEIGTDLYLLAMSPFTMLDQWMRFSWPKSWASTP